jgi:hypothetical protein
MHPKAFKDRLLYIVRWWITEGFRAFVQIDQSYKYLLSAARLRRVAH